jgi:hypothetical protein
MTEAEWLTTTDPTSMVDFIQSRGSVRKLRLFFAACARLVWDYIPMDDARQAVEVAERYAADLASEDERDRAAKRLWALPAAGEMAGHYAVAVSSGAAQDWLRNPAVTGAFAFMCAQLAVHRQATTQTTSLAAWRAATGATGAKQPALLRDIFGNPFHPVTFAPEWRTGTAVSLAAQMYESRDFGAMPILADALQDAGCDSEDILNHCRGPGPHVRGCWVVDLVLGKA